MKDKTALISDREQTEMGDRFEFGKNWASFLTVLNDERIAEAVKSLQNMLGVERLDNMRFLDGGSGSGLFSLAARMLGAKVHSFDYDPQSVACTKELRQRYFPGDPNWTVERGSVLDVGYLNSLGQFDIVYSWGVLHHTGSMWEALENVSATVRKGGTLFISIYNDQSNEGFWRLLAGGKSRAWRAVKKTYCSGKLGKYAVVGLFVPYFVLTGLAADVLGRRNPIARYTEYKKSRGMSRLHDWIDWLGGYPFEVAKPEEIFEFYNKKGFQLTKLKTRGGGTGCNEFVFVKE